MTALDRAAAAALAREPAVLSLFAALDGAGDEVRIVGGAVRNALLGRRVSDVDLATTALPAETVRRARKAGFRAVPTGIAHGTVTVLAAGRPFEVTTLREDVETDGRHALVRFGRDFTADALRRDFTVNALAVDRDGRIHDATGGLADLEAGRVRFIGEARERIREDFLRILRFFRFTAAYAEGPPDLDGLAAAIAERDGLATLSRERVRAELLKLLVARRGPELVGILSGCGLLLRLVGGVAETGRLSRADAADPIGRLAAGFAVTVEDADRLRERLRLSNQEHDRVAGYASVSARLKSAARLGRAEIRRAAFLFGREALRDWAAAVAPEGSPPLEEDGRAQLDAFVRGGEPMPVLPLTGAELLRRGATPGPEIGRRLAKAREEWLAAGCP